MNTLKPFESCESGVEKASSGMPSQRQCPQCGQLFMPQGADECECPECKREWREYWQMRHELAYPGVWM